MTRSHHLRKALSCALTVLVILFAVPFAGAADGTEFVIRRNVREVRLSFSVSDNQGHRVTELRPSDLVVVDNEIVIRNFRSLRPASETPINLAILIDASGSMARDIARIVEVVKRFVADTRWEPRDRVSIIAFGGSDARALCALHCASPSASEALSGLRADGVTPLYDVLVRSTGLLATDADPESRPALVLFSDGLDTYSMHSASDAIAAAQSLDAPIYALVSRQRIPDPDGERLLRLLSRSTGGFVIDDQQSPEQSLRLVIEDLRGGFVLTYQPIHSTVPQHSLQILPAKDPRLRFRSRGGYRDVRVSE